MVAPLVLNRPTRVFARLTHTGENKTSEAVCCDLSRMASIMPANPLPKNLSFPHVVESNVAMTTTPAPSSAIKLLSPLYKLCTEKSTSSKRKRENGDGDEVQDLSTNNLSPYVVRAGNESPPAKIVKLDSESEERGINARSENKVLTCTEASKLLIENVELKRENEVLKNEIMHLHMMLQELQRRQSLQQGSL